MTEAKRNRDPETLDIVDNLQRCSGQLSTLLYFITGAGLAQFQELAAENQAEILSLAHDLAERIDEAGSRL